MIEKKEPSCGLVRAQLTQIGLPAGWGATSYPGCCGVRVLHYFQAAPIETPEEKQKRREDYKMAHGCYPPDPVVVRPEEDLQAMMDKMCRDQAKAWTHPTIFICFTAENPQSSEQKIACARLKELGFFLAAVANTSHVGHKYPVKLWVKVVEPFGDSKTGIPAWDDQESNPPVSPQSLKVMKKAAE